jgi:hypothetical protein
MDCPELPKLGFQRSYLEDAQFVTMVGMAVIEDDEVDEDRFAKAKLVAVGFRPFKVSAGQDKEYFAFARIPIDFAAQLGDKDRAKVYFGEADENLEDKDYTWTAVALQNKFPLQATEDIVLSLRRPITKGTDGAAH